MLKKILLFFFIFIYLGKSSKAQINIKFNDSAITSISKGIEYAYSIDNNFTNESLRKLVAGKLWFPLDNKIIKYSYSSQCLWLKIPIYKISKPDLDFLSIQNPHINYLKSWVLDNRDSVIKDFALTGDHLPFASRQVNSNFFAFPLLGITEDSLKIVLAFDKRYTKLDLPIRLYSLNNFVESMHKQNILVGTSLGILLLFLLIGCLLFFFLKDRLHFIYSIYILMLFFYILIDNGIMFEFVYPNQPKLNDLIRPGISLFSIVPLFFFFIQLLNFKKNSAQLYKLNLIIILCYVVIFCVAMIDSYSHLMNQGKWLKLASFLVVSIFTNLFIQVCFLVYKQVKHAALAFLSLIIIIFSILIISLESNEVITQNFFTKNIIIIGIISLTTSMLLAIFRHYKDLKQQSEILTKENEIQKVNFIREITKWEKEQMQRISSFMHDNVGANLGLLRLGIDRLKVDEESRKLLIKQVLELSNEVRDISHSFSPLNLKEIGLHNSVKNIVKRINEQSSIALAFQWNSTSHFIKEEYQVIVFRIVQELLNNLLKHSKAKSAFLEIMPFDDFISIYIEDDGIGFQNIKQSQSLGLRSIEDIITLLKGTFIINSSPKCGTNISIEFKISNYE